MDIQQSTAGIGVVAQYPFGRDRRVIIAISITSTDLNRLNSGAVGLGFGGNVEILFDQGASRWQVIEQNQRALGDLLQVIDHLLLGTIHRSL